MGESAKGKGAARGRIGAEAQAAFLAALRAGAGVEGAAKAGGFSAHGFYSLRWRDPAFRLAWDMARELCEAAVVAERRASGRAGAGEGGEGEVRLTPSNQRSIQQRPMRWVKFTPERRALFLACFAATADATRAAGEAGVSVATVYKARRDDPEFAAAFDAALAEAYVRLEAEAVRQRLAAQEAMKAAEVEPTIQMAEEFDRVMALLRRWDRGGGKPGVREIAHGRMKSYSFDDAMELLARRLEALGYQPLLPPPEQEGTVTGNCPHRPQLPERPDG
jgi:hypothetical protein